MLLSTIIWSIAPTKYEVVLIAAIKVDCYCSQDDNIMMVCSICDRLQGPGEIIDDSS